MLQCKDFQKEGGAQSLPGTVEYVSEAKFKIFLWLPAVSTEVYA